MSVGGDIGTPFIQPMYKPFPVVQDYWKQNVSSVTFRDTLCVQKVFRTVVCHKKYTGSSADMQEIMSWMVRIFTDLEFNPAQILDCMMQYADVSTEVTNVGICLIKMWSRGKK